MSLIYAINNACIVSREMFDVLHTRETGQAAQRRLPFNKKGLIAPNLKGSEVKNPIKLIKCVHASPLALAMAGAVLLAALAPSALAGGNVLPPQSSSHGASYADWSAQWWQWSLSQDASDITLAGPGADSHVWFLAGAPGPVVETNYVTIPTGTALFFSILSTWADNSGCGTNGEPAFTDLTVPELRSEIEDMWSAVSSTSCWIDGKPVDGLNPTTSGFHVESPAFSYTTALENNVLANIYGDTCIPGGLTISPAVADGVYLMVNPFSPGTHVIHWIGVVGPASAPFFTEDITYVIQVK